MAEVKGKLSRLRIAPRKVREVSALVIGMDYEPAKELLNNTTKKAARPLMRLLDSTAANGYNNFDLVKENLYVKNITVDEGIKLKRVRPKGFGMAAWIEKKSSHVNLVLDERVKGMKRKAEDKKKVEAPKEEVKEVSEDKEKQVKQQEVQKELGRKGGLFGNLKKKMFRRKAI